MSDEVAGKVNLRGQSKRIGCWGLAGILLAVQLAIGVGFRMFPRVDLEHDGIRYICYRDALKCCVPFLGWFVIVVGEPSVLEIRDAGSGRLIRLERPDYCSDVFDDYPFLREVQAQQRRGR